MEELTYIRNEFVDNVGPWTWIKIDNGSWDGPKDDWEKSHRNIVKQHVKKFDCVVQAGGNMGLYPRLYSEFFSLVYTFEPDELNFHCLVNNCQKENIIKIQAALGNEHHMIRMRKKCLENTGMHSIEERTQGIIPMLRLDDFEFPTLDLIHLDVEGYELRCLQGAMKTLETHKPALLLEMPTFSIQNLLKPLNYKIVARSCSDTLFLPESIS